MIEISNKIAFKYGAFSNIGNATSARYAKKNITMFELLKDMETRSPGSYFDVIDDGVFASLFFGRPHHRIDQKDARKTNEEKTEEAKKFIDNIIGSKAVQYNNSFLFNLYTDASKKPLIHNKNRTQALAHFLEQVVPFCGGSFSSLNYNPQPALTDLYSGAQEAQNFVYAISGQNLIANSIIVNSQTYNTVTVDYDPNLWTKLNDIVHGKFVSKVSVCSYPTIKKFEDRVKELVHVDDQICTVNQAVEVGQSLLIRNLEKYYDGSLIITFDPRIKYRTEVYIYDSVNKMYGSIVVRDYEHKIDSRGSYTIIKPMMKIEAISISADAINRGYRNFMWRDAIDYYNDSTGSDEASDLAAKFNKMSNSLKKIQTNFENKSNQINMIELDKLKSNALPISVGTFAVRHNNGDEAGQTEYYTAKENLTPFVAFPLIQNYQVLMPDLDLYNLTPEGSWFSKFTDLFKKNPYKFDLSDLGSKQGALSYIAANLKERVTDDFVRTSTVKVYSQNGALPFIQDQVELYSKIKSIMARDKFFAKATDSDDHNVSTVKNKKTGNLNSISFGFLNCKVLTNASSEGERYKRVAEIVSNFDVIGLCELAITDKSKSIIEPQKVCDNIVNHLNGGIGKKVIYAYKVIFDRKGGLGAQGFSEALAVIYKKGAGVVLTSEPLPFYYTDATGTETSIVALKVTATKNNNQKTVTFVHNVYLETNLAYGQKIRLALLQKLISYFDNYQQRDSLSGNIKTTKAVDQTDAILGDFNLDIINKNQKSLVDNRFVAQLVDKNKEKLAANQISCYDFESVLSEKTTVTAAGFTSQPYDKILINKKAKKFLSNDRGVFDDILKKYTISSYYKNISDHLPIYIVFKKG